MTLCPVCAGDLAGKPLLCGPCGRSLDRVTGRDIYSIVVWAAARSRAAMKKVARAASHEGKTLMPTAEELALKKYPRSAALRATFVRGVQAAKSGASDNDNPYHGPRSGFGAANNNAWREGWVAFWRKEVTCG